MREHLRSTLDNVSLGTLLLEGFKHVKSMLSPFWTSIEARRSFRFLDASGSTWVEEYHLRLFLYWIRCRKIPKIQTCASSMGKDSLGSPPGSHWEYMIRSDLD